MKFAQWARLVVSYVDICFLRLKLSLETLDTIRQVKSWLIV